MARGKLTEQEAQLAANTLRMLAVDAVERAHSGHPGLPMGAADYAFTLWHSFMQFDPTDPSWPNRDRFILSAGHGSMLLYGLLHLFGFGLPLDELKRFRQWRSLTPGHPEAGHPAGVEVTTGPLGQGFANAVGMALAGKMAGERFRDATFSPISHRVFALASDGDLMEGITAEAASLAGHLRLGNLVVLYDDNNITIEGRARLAFSEDVPLRFQAMGWHVQRIDGHNIRQINDALATALAVESRPSLIVARTKIGMGSPNRQDSPEIHGSPLGADEVRATRENLSWPDEEFHVPAEVRDLCSRRRDKLAELRHQWELSFIAWRERNPERAQLWDTLWSGRISPELASELLKSVEGSEGPTRLISGQVLQRAASLVPALVGGSADLAPSTNSWIKGSDAVAADIFDGRNIHFGVREHAMAAMMNGMSRYGCFIPFGATFLVFSDYCRPAIRLAALMKCRVIYLFTHDSLFVGEDGPTHQPVEQLSSLRLIPGLSVWRPADAIETAMAWSAALSNPSGPSALILTRQKVPMVERDRNFESPLVLKGGYVVSQGGEFPQVTVMASGSELHLAAAAVELLRGQGVRCRLVSIPSLETFLSQSHNYIQAVIPPESSPIAIEAGKGELWHQLTGDRGLVIGMETFGASAPAEVLTEKFGFMPEEIAERIVDFLAGPLVPDKP